MKPDSNLLFLTLAIAVGLGVSGCDKSTGPLSDGSVPSFRGISNQLRSTCPSLIQPDTSIATPDAHPRTPWPATTDSVNLGIYNAFGILIVQGSFALPAYAFETGNPPFTPWTARFANGQPVPTGHYFYYYVLRDSTGAVVGRDSLCIGVLNAGT